MSVEKIQIQVEKLPFVVIYRPLLQDCNISLKAKGLLAWLIDKPDNWDCTIAGIATQCRDGIKSIQAAVYELVKYGYLEIIQIRNEKGHFDHNKWKVSQISKNVSDSPFPENGLPENRKSSIRNTQEEKLIEKEKESKPKKESSSPAMAPCSPSAEASELSLFLFNSIRERKPDFKETNLERWSIEFDRMIKIDKRTISRLKELISWVGGHTFWSTNILSPDALRKQFDKLDLQFSKDNGKVNGNEDVMKMFHEVCERMDQKGYRENVTVGYNYIEFSLNNHIIDHIKSNDAEIKARLANVFRKLGLKR